MTATEIDSLPVCDRLPPVRTNAELLGRLYVVEGAGLGGSVLAAKLVRLLAGDRETEGRRFLAGLAAPDPLPWPTFWKCLEIRRALANTVVIVKSAETTFRTMADWLSEGEHNV